MGGGKMYESEWDEYPKKEERWRVRPGKESGFLEEVKIDAREDDDADWHTVSYCLDMLKRLEEGHDDRIIKPLFLTCGIVKPHLPWTVPRRYYSMYPLDDIQLPPHIDTDLNDCPTYAVTHMARPETAHADIQRLQRWEDAVQSYLATIRYADMNIGRLLDGYDQLSESIRNNTIIFFFFRPRMAPWREAALAKDKSLGGGDVGAVHCCGSGRYGSGIRIASTRRPNVHLPDSLRSCRVGRTRPRRWG